MTHLDRLDKYDKLEILRSHERTASKMESSNSVEELEELEASIGMTIDELRDEIYYLNKILQTKTENIYSAEQIANYIDEKINLTPNSNWTIYEGPTGLSHTKGSMEYRDEEHKKVMSFITMDEAPESLEALINNVEFQMNK